VLCDGIVLGSLGFGKWYHGSLFDFLHTRCSLQKLHRQVGQNNGLELLYNRCRIGWQAWTFIQLELLWRVAVETPPLNCGTLRRRDA
jgi:hypothetical protein